MQPRLDLSPIASWRIDHHLKPLRWLEPEFSRQRISVARGLPNEDRTLRSEPRHHLSNMRCGQRGRMWTKKIIPTKRERRWRPMHATAVHPTRLVWQHAKQDEIQRTCKESCEEPGIRHRPVKPHDARCLLPQRKISVANARAARNWTLVQVNRGADPKIALRLSAMMGIVAQNDTPVAPRTTRPVHP